MTPDSTGGPAGFLLRAALLVHAVASLGYWIAQPRGFPLLSRSFLEHQAVVPILFAVSAAGVAALLLKRHRTVWIAVGILAGFWISSSSLIVVLGSTWPSRLFWGALPAALGLLWLSSAQARPGLLTGGTVAGLVLASLFWLGTWAPPATTRPRGAEFPPPAAVSESAAMEKEGIRVSVVGAEVHIESGTGKAVLRPGFDYGSISDDGLWTIFQFRSSRLPPWTCGRSREGALAIAAENDDFLCSGRIWIQDRVVRVRCTTKVLRATASHLSSIMQLDLPGAAAVEGIPWELDHTHGRSEFVAIRNGRTEFLRARKREKGPFETVAAWDLRDPVLTVQGWRIQVLGWAEQGSPEASPTAGWGVSQATLERAGATYFWSLASTSIGRGWHTVRTAPGVYVLEAVLTPP